MSDQLDRRIDVEAERRDLDGRGPRDGHAVTDLPVGVFSPAEDRAVETPSTRMIAAGSDRHDRSSELLPDFAWSCVGLVGCVDGRSEDRRPGRVAPARL